MTASRHPPSRAPNAPAANPLRPPRSGPPPRRPRLKDKFVRAVGKMPEGGEQSGKGGGRRAGGRILRNAETRREHARVEIMSVRGFTTEDEYAARIVGTEGAIPNGRIRPA